MSSETKGPGSKNPAPLPATANFIRKVPDGDNLARQVCVDCGFINYENPKIVVGAVCHWGDRVLLCRRAINPRICGTARGARMLFSRFHHMRTVRSYVRPFCAAHDRWPR